MHHEYILLVLLVYISTVYALEEGDACTIKSSGQSGICTSILKCPAALQLIKQRKRPQGCAFMGTIPIVCCEQSTAKPISKPITTTTTTTPRTTTTTTGTTESTYVNPYRPNSTGYKSYQKCIEYSNLVFTYEKPPVLLIDKEEEKVNTCGFEVVPLIIGGVPADRREFPHMALVGYESSDGVQWLCGGSLISERFVLTAGHCIISREFGNATRVRMGVTKIDDPNHRQDISIVDRIRHPQYAPPSHYNDIALLRLAKNANFDIYVRPACLYYDSKTLNEHAVATGWGKTDFAGFSSDELLKVTLELIDASTCNSSFKRVSHLRLSNGIDAITQVCAGSPGKDTCQGDSGGPLQIYSKIDCMYEIVGVTSFGKACGIGKSPGVYTRVAHYMDWLEKAIW